MVLKIGHRGCYYKKPNSKESILYAINNLKVDMVEIDIRLTKDNILVLHHDSNINEKEIYDYNYEELCKFKKLEKLKDIIKIIPNKCKIYLDIKKSINNFNNDYINCIENKLLEIIKSLDFNYNIIIASFDHKLIRSLMNKLIKNKTLFIDVCYLFHEFQDCYIENYIKDNDIDYISINVECVSKKIINICHNNNIKVLCYTVNNKKIIEELKKIGIDGIISDYPDKI